MIYGLETKKLRMLNNLAQIETAEKIDKILKYVMELDADKKTLYIEAFHPNSSYCVGLKAKIDEIELTGIIPIEDSKMLDDILSGVVKSDKIDIYIEDNYVKIDDNGTIINLPYFKESKKDIRIRKDIQACFNTRNYGDTKNKLNMEGYEEPDATCKLDPKKLNLKKITKIFNKGLVNIGVENETFFVSIGQGKNKQPAGIIKPIKKEEGKDPSYFKGECTVAIQDINCFSTLGNYDGHIIVDLRKGYPLAIKKKFTKERIGISYMVSLMKDKSQNKSNK